MASNFSTEEVGNELRRRRAIFECLTCGAQGNKKTTEDHLIRRHLLENPPFSCKCGSKFARQTKAKSHVQSKHDGEMYGNLITPTEVPPLVQSMARNFRHEEALAFCARKLEAAVAQANSSQPQPRSEKKRPAEGEDAPPTKKLVAAAKTRPPALKAAAETESAKPTQPNKKPAAKVQVVKPAPPVEEPVAGASSTAHPKSLPKSAPKSAPKAAQKSTPKSTPAATTPATSAAPVGNLVPSFSPLPPTPTTSLVLSPWSTPRLTLHAPEGDELLRSEAGSLCAEPAPTLVAMIHEVLANQRLHTEPLDKLEKAQREHHQKMEEELRTCQVAISVLQDKLDGLEDPLQAVTNNTRSAQGESKKCMEKLNVFMANITSCKADCRKCLEKLATVAADVASCKGELRHSSTQETRDATRLKALVGEVGEGVRRGLEAMEGCPWYSNIAMPPDGRRPPDGTSTCECSRPKST